MRIYAAAVAGVSDFFGVAFAAFLTGVFFGAAFLPLAAVADLAGTLVTRPDLVLPRTLGSSIMAGACRKIKI